MRLQLPLASLYRALLDAARTEGVEMLASK